MDRAKKTFNVSVGYLLDIGGTLSLGVGSFVCFSYLSFSSSLPPSLSQENEKLYSQLIEAQSALRSTREQLATDTQRLRTELANSK